MNKMPLSAQKYSFSRGNKIVSLISNFFFFAFIKTSNVSDQLSSFSLNGVEELHSLWGRGSPEVCAMSHWSVK